MPQTKREKVLAARTRRYVEVPMSDLLPGVSSIRLQSLTEGEKTKFRMVRDGAASAVALADAIASEPRRRIVATAVEDDGSPMFSVLDVIEMESTDSAVVERLNEWAIMHLSPMATVEDLAKNSGATAGTSSPVKSA